MNPLRFVIARIRPVACLGLAVFLPATVCPPMLPAQPPGPTDALRNLEVRQSDSLLKELTAGMEEPSRGNGIRYEALKDPKHITPILDLRKLIYPPEGDMPTGYKRELQQTRKKLAKYLQSEKTPDGVAETPRARELIAVVVALDDKNRAVGYAAAELLEGSFVEIAQVAVRPRWQGKGIGTVLFEELFQRVKQIHGLNAVFLMDNSEQGQMRKIAVSHGFETAKPGDPVNKFTLEEEAYVWRTQEPGKVLPAQVPGFDFSGADTPELQQRNVLSLLEFLGIDPTGFVVNVGSGVRPFVFGVSPRRAPLNLDTQSYAREAAERVGADYANADITQIAAAVQPGHVETLPEVLLFYRMGSFADIYHGPNPQEFWEAAWELVRPGGWILLVNPPSPEFSIPTLDHSYRQIFSSLPAEEKPSEVRIVSPDGTLANALAIALRKPAVGAGLEEEQLRQYLEQNQYPGGPIQLIADVFSKRKANVVVLADMEEWVEETPYDQFLKRLVEELAKQTNVRRVLIENQPGIVEQEVVPVLKQMTGTDHEHFLSYAMSSGNLQEIALASSVARHLWPMLRRAFQLGFSLSGFDPRPHANKSGELVGNHSLPMIGGATEEGMRDEILKQLKGNDQQPMLVIAGGNHIPVTEGLNRLGRLLSQTEGIRVETIGMDVGWVEAEERQLGEALYRMDLPVVAIADTQQEPLGNLQYFRGGVLVDWGGNSISEGPEQVISVRARDFTGGLIYFRSENDIVSYLKDYTAGLEEARKRVGRLMQEIAPPEGLKPVVILAGLEEQHPELRALGRVSGLPVIFAGQMTPEELTVELITQFDAHSAVLAGLEEEIDQYQPIAGAGIALQLVTPSRAGQLILSILAKAAGLEEADLLNRNAGRLLDDLTALGRGA